MDEIKKKKKRQGGRGWSPEEGPNDVRFLPPESRYFEEDIGDIAIGFNLHLFRQEGFDTEASRCLRDKHEYCPACEIAAQFRDDEQDPALAKQAEDVRRFPRYAFNIVDLDEPDLGVQPYVGPKGIWEDLIEYMGNPKWGDIFHPKTGRDITITKTPGSKNPSGYPSYSVQPDPNTRDRIDLLPDGWKSDLDELKFAVTDYMDEEDMLRILDRMGFPVDAPGVEDEEPGGEDPGKPTGGSAEPSGAASAPSEAPQTPTPSEDPEPAPEPEPEPSPEPETPSEPEPEPEPQETPGGELEGDPTAKALKRAGDPEGIINPPADTEDQTPFCYGDYDLDRHPCGGCAVKADCQRAMLGMD